MFCIIIIFNDNDSLFQEHHYGWQLLRKAVSHKGTQQPFDVVMAEKSHFYGAQRCSFFIW